MSLFSVDEVAEVNHYGDGSYWSECIVIAIGTSDEFEDKDYTVNVPTRPCQHSFSGFWAVDEQYLRKKRPPQQDCEVAEEWFIEDFNRIFKEPVEDKV